MSIIYSPKYVDISSIQRKLKYRLKINFLGTNEIPNPFNQYNDILQNSVDNELLLDLIQEAEAEVDNYLSLVYVLPLINKHPIVSNCVESFVFADLMQIHFSSAVFPENNDITGFGLANRNNAYQIIKSLTYSLNLTLPGIQNESSTNPYVYNQAIVLPGESLVTNRQNIVNEKTIVNSKYNKPKSVKDIDFTSDNVFAEPHGLESKYGLIGKRSNDNYTDWS